MDEMDIVRKITHLCIHIAVMLPLRGKNSQM